MRLLTNFHHSLSVAFFLSISHTTCLAVDYLTPTRTLEGELDLWEENRPDFIDEIDSSDVRGVDSYFLNVTSEVNEDTEGRWGFPIIPSTTETQVRMYTVHFWLHYELAKDVRLSLEIRHDAPGSARQSDLIIIPSTATTEIHSKEFNLSISPYSSQIEIRCQLTGGVSDRDHIHIDAISIEETILQAGTSDSNSRDYCCYTGSCSSREEASTSVFVDWSNDWVSGTQGFRVHRKDNLGSWISAYTTEDTTKKMDRVNLPSTPPFHELRVQKVVSGQPSTICEGFIGSLAWPCRPNGYVPSTYVWTEEPDWTILDDSVEHYGSGSADGQSIRVFPEDADQKQTWSTTNPSLSLSGNAKFRVHLLWRTQQGSTQPPDSVNFWVSVDVGSNHHPISDAPKSMNHTSITWDTVDSSIENVSGWNFNDLTVSLEPKTFGAQVNSVRIDVLYVDIIPMP